MTRSWRRLAVLVPVLLATAGCFSLRLQRVSEDYYLRGAETALAALDETVLEPADRGLGELEKAMALLELGRYRPALELLDRASARLDASPDPWTVRGADGSYLGEHHERVMVRTLATAAALALQDVDGAARRAPAVIAEIERGSCGTCDFPFSRWVAAIALEAAGRRHEAVAALSPAVGGNPFLRAEIARLGYGPDPGEGFAPPPTAGGSGQRALVILALLGAAPEKTMIDISGATEWVPWPRYETVWPSVAADVALVCDDGSTFPGSQILDLDRLAPAALEARRRHERELAVAAGRRQRSDVDMRCWTALPAVAEAIRAEIAPAVARCELVAAQSSGQEASRERIDVPEDWHEGPLFVLRRIP